ncbi:60S ribosomal protein L38 [Coccidioides immitis H538.4]|uniref:60S ribosomal protein L38 n=2 Tax=Coccidioides immitis TaxID=5501 RepID=A0A0J8UX66_COCIT|nr:60S ribosomal protein L38 [Coccidioides immitis RMSCC 2394]KMU92523.1 60S ribosomal protein L38 [Coccidioides immitis H538.4]
MHHQLILDPVFVPFMGPRLISLTFFPPSDPGDSFKRAHNRLPMCLVTANMLGPCQKEFDRVLTLITNQRIQLSIENICSSVHRTAEAHR